jgi:hypothetical protein
MEKVQKNSVNSVQHTPSSESFKVNLLKMDPAVVFVPMVTAIVVPLSIILIGSSVD